jgi:ankyrin repeat protein
VYVGDTSEAANANARQAVIQGDVEAVKEWLGKKKNKENSPKWGDMLVLAAAHGQNDICRLLTDTGLVDGSTVLAALQWACYKGHLSTSKLLLCDSGLSFDRNALNKVLVSSSTVGHTDVVMWLFNIMNLSRAEKFKWQLATSSGCGDMDTVSRLVDETVEVVCNNESTTIYSGNACNEQQIITSDEVHEAFSQALRTACFQGRTDVVDLILALTSSTSDIINARGAVWYDDKTPLMAACCRCHGNVVRRLLKTAAITQETINLQSGLMGSTALHYAIWCQTDQLSPLLRLYMLLFDLV